MTNDIFINNEIYKKASDIFEIKSISVEEIKEKCIFVIDTNALLIPYSTSSGSLVKLTEIYKNLIDQLRLFIPGQVAREFANNRPNKIKELFQTINRQKNNSKTIKIGNYPILSNLASYQEIQRLEKEINYRLEKYNEQITFLAKEIKLWSFNDPVSEIYRNLFKKEVIKDLDLSQEIKINIKKELEKRYQHKIPPGFKDSAKEDLGIGDYLIWKTILEIGAEQKKDLVFISGDEKSDWFYRSEQQALFPRFELITEFFDYSGGKSFNIIKLSNFLELFSSDREIVREIKEEEEDRARKYYQRTFNLLIENRLIKENDLLFLKRNLPIGINFEDHKNKLTCIVTGKLGRSNNVRWNFDNNEYAISPLTSKIFTEFNGEYFYDNGNFYWENKDGQSLYELAQNFLNGL
ncbi:hypothetical protein LPTSP4_36020 [Leptospira ryugenii]|uniref:PIN like domain-containing protein n=1 Tax=Leptospira ryugenii TaxID=1917863 RepID=A0A2P2E5D5_9LEPT|nr:PIN domain-containing protein [Leptospira ryugenii]GBF52064.1 hypothetical protein LPTSP4_36020 [Leptospira ryugenii]